VLSFATHPVYLSFVVIYFGYFIVFEATLGATPGKFLLGLRAVCANEEIQYNSRGVNKSDNGFSN